MTNISMAATTATTLVGQWDMLVEADPGAPAIVTDGGTLSREHLDDRVRRTCRGLQERTPDAPTGAEQVVAILAPHGPATIVAIVAVLRAGYGYLVLDPRWPAARLDRCTDAARPLAVLAAGSAVDRARALRAAPTVIDLDEVGTTSGDARTDTLPAEGLDGGSALAYLLFTSGSTGTPKAVRQSQRGVLLCADNQRRALDLGPGDVLTLLTPFCYDMAAVDLWSALLSGAAIAPYDLAAAGIADLGRFLEQHAVTVFHSAPTVLRTLGQLHRPISAPVRTVLLGGEPAVRRDVLVARTLFGSDVCVASGYGSTEASFSTMFLLPGAVADDTARPAAGDALPMGQPLPGFTVRLAATGEIVVTGEGVALGYLGASGGDTQGDTHGDSPFRDEGAGVRTFRTGDLGERVSGQLYHRGRLDRQIKVRGVRVDPTEVEALLLDVPGITGALVSLDRVPLAVSPGEDEAPSAVDRLVATITTEPGLPIDPASVHGILSAQLPSAMVPSRYVRVDRLDVTDTGKRLRPTTPPAIQPGSSSPAPGTLIEHVLASVSEILQIPVGELDPQAPLFEFGAHSLDLVRIHAAVAAFARIELVDLLELGSINAIVEHLAASDPACQVVLTRSDARDTVQPAGGQLEDPQHEHPQLEDPQFEDPQHRVAAPTDIAVIGMAGRYPGSPDLDALWDNVLGRRDVIRDLSDDELRAEGVPESLLARADLVRAGGQLENADCFDTAYFGIDAAEAPLIDPQHRLFLEVAEGALQHGGYGVRPPGTVTAVFAAAGPNRLHLDRMLPLLRSIDESWDTLLPSGIGADHMVARTAYRLGLDGPAVAVAATCAGSLAAVCTAATALIDLQCDLAVAGGVHLTSPRYLRRGPGTTSADGRCRALSADADGAGMSSGAGAVLLKRHQDAIDDGDTVLAVLRGCAMTNDGAARAGFNTPGIAGQQAAVDQALAAADVLPEQIGAVFCHALGTPLGDAIEVGALRRVWTSVEQRSTTRLVAPKTHLGNLDVASGIAALQLAVLSIRRGRIPGNLHFGSAGPLLELDGSGLSATAESHPWTEGAPRLAGISSFGAGGTNVHLVIEGAPTAERLTTPLAAPELSDIQLPVTLALSALTPAAAVLMAIQLADHLAEHRPDLRAVAQTLLHGRRRLPHRLVVTAGSLSEAINALRSAAADPGGTPVGQHDAVMGRERPDVRRIPLPGYPFSRSRIPGPEAAIESAAALVSQAGCTR